MQENKNKDAALLGNFLNTTGSYPLLAARGETRWVMGHFQKSSQQRKGMAPVISKADLTACKPQCKKSLRGPFIPDAHSKLFKMRPSFICHKIAHTLHL